MKTSCTRKIHSFGAVQDDEKRERENETPGPRKVIQKEKQKFKF